MRKHRIAIGLAAALIEFSAARAQTPLRSEAPIREVLLENGSRHYTIMIKVGSVSLETGLDTGSTGLRVLPGVLGDSDAQADGGDDSYAYGSGTRLKGVTGTANVSVGALSGNSGLQLVRDIDCVPRKPHCPASLVSQDKFGLMGEGLPGRGYRAIMGINMAQADVPNPLIAIGARWWIVELPRPGEAAPGKLILNPGDDEIKGFVMLPILPQFRARQGGLHDAIAGCILDSATKAKACGAMVLDSGAPGIRIVNSDLSNSDLQNGASGLLAFYDGGSLRAAEQFTAFSRAQATHIEIRTAPRPPLTAIYAGLTPYFAFDVLYDPAKGMIGLKPREPTPDGPRAELAP